MNRQIGLGAFIHILTLLIALPLFGAGSPFGLTRAQQEELIRDREDQQQRLESALKKNHIGLELLTAGPSSLHISSNFGHTGIRLIDENDNPLDDTVLSFEMISLGKGDELWRGVFGGGHVVIRTMPLSSWLLRYVLNEGRGFERTILPSDPVLMEALKASVLRVSKLPALVDSYNFFGNNCATLMRRILQETGYPIPYRLIEVPTQMSRRFASALLTYAPPLIAPSPTAVFSAFVCRYMRKIGEGIQCRRMNSSGESRNQLIKRVLSDEGFWTFLRSEPPGYVSILINLWPYSLDQVTAGTDRSSLSLNQERLRSLRAHLADQFVPLSELVRTLPPAAYRICGARDAECRQSRMQAVLQRWSQKELADYLKTLKLKYELPAPGVPIDVDRAPLTSPLMQDMRSFHLELLNPS
jgi:hypothetical protein